MIDCAGYVVTPGVVEEKYRVHCNGCTRTDPSDATEEAMREMLRKLEWVYIDAAGVGICPKCQHAEDVGFGGGHAPGCSLAALLTRLK